MVKEIIIEYDAGFKDILLVLLLVASTLAVHRVVSLSSLAYVVLFVWCVLLAVVIDYIVRFFSED